MFVGELEFVGLDFGDSWVGYITFTFFLFFVTIVLMNVLNGLAVSDVTKILQDVDIKHQRQRLSQATRLPMLTEEVLVYPNAKPRRKRILWCIPTWERVSYSELSPLHFQSYAN